MSNSVAHPAHYNSGRVEVIEFIEDQKLDYHRGNCLKYVCRAGKKDPAKLIEDIQKAIWYLERFIEIQKEDPRRPNDMRWITPSTCTNLSIRTGTVDIHTGETKNDLTTEIRPDDTRPIGVIIEEHRKQKEAEEK